jgi:hypothetical protein
MIGDIKDTTKGLGEEAKDIAKGQMDAAKAVDKDASKDEALKQKEAMKPQTRPPMPEFVRPLLLKSAMGMEEVRD